MIFLALVFLKMNKNLYVSRSLQFHLWTINYEYLRLFEGNLKKFFCFLPNNVTKLFCE